MDEVWKIISNISVNFDGANLNYSNFEDVFARMCADTKTFNGLKLENLSKEAILINNDFDPKFNFITDKNIDNNNSIRLYKGRVLVKENDVVNIERDGDSNIVKENVVFNVSEDILEKYLSLIHI